MLAAGVAVFITEGYERASIETVARDAEVARGTFYLYFNDKLALFQAIVSPWTNGLLSLVEQASATLSTAERPAEARAHYEQMALGIAQLGLMHQDAIMMAFRELRSPSDAGVWLRAEEEILLQRVTEITILARDRGLIVAPHPAITVRIIVGAVERLTFDVFMGSKLGDPLLVASEVVRLFSASLFDGLEQ